MKSLVACAALACLTLAGAGGREALGDETAKSPADELAALWTGVFDTGEQVVYGGDDDSELASDIDERRVRTMVVPVSLPWLGTQVLYLEEFLHEDPGNPRRMMLLRLEPDLTAAKPAVRVRQFTFREPARWRRLYRSSERMQQLTREDLEAIPSCDLKLVQEGEHFRGGTAKRRCIVGTGEPGRYVDYQVLIGNGLYWYHRRLLSFTDDELLEEVIGFDWFELHEARLFTCRVRWMAQGSANAPREIAVVDLHDQGGTAKFTTPDGLGYELALHSGDWPFDTNRDALILLVRSEGTAAPLASSWTGLDDERIEIDLGWLDVGCGAIESERASAPQLADQPGNSRGGDPDGRARDEKQRDHHDDQHREAAAPHGTGPREPFLQQHAIAQVCLEPEVDEIAEQGNRADQRVRRQIDQHA
jgi:hypothetical protein